MPHLAFFPVHLLSMSSNSENDLFELCCKPAFALTGTHDIQYVIITHLPHPLIITCSAAHLSLNQIA